MTSGFGLRGGLGRCYHFWADFKECKVRMNRLQIIELLEGTATENRDGTIGIYRALILLKSRHYFLATGIIRRRKELDLPFFLTLSLTHTHKHTRCTHDHTMLQAEKERLPGICWAEREDYFECLHSKKEYEQVARVNEQLEINLQKEKEIAAAVAKAGVS